MEEIDFSKYYSSILQNIKIEPISAIMKEFRANVAKNPDVEIWLGKVGYSTRPEYLLSLSYFLKCVGIQDPTELLDIKTHEDIKRRFFPAERLVEVWHAKAKIQGVKEHRQKKVLDAIRSFFKYSRVPLIQIKSSYKPRPKDPLSDDELRKFRETLSWRDTILYDFLFSVPLRDGQFQVCPNCGRDFHPKWKNILTFPTIAPYSPFMTTPQKGHENTKYPEGLMQVCFLTETAAKDLNMLRDLKEKQLDRRLRPDDYIFTYMKNVRGGSKHVTPIAKFEVQDVFEKAQDRTGIRIYPHLIRAWVNTRLATCGIDKQLRDIYLGHCVQANEEGYIMQMLTKWRETFQRTKAIESLDIVLGVIGPQEFEAKLMQVEEQRREIERLKSELTKFNLNEEDMENLRWLLEQIKTERTAGLQASSSAELRDQGKIFSRLLVNSISAYSFQCNDSCHQVFGFI